MTLQTHLYKTIAEARQCTGPQAQDHASADLHQSWSWFENLERYGLPADVQPACVIVQGADARATVGLPFALQPRSQAALFGPAVSALTTYYSSLFGPVGHEVDCGVDACRAALQALRGLGSAADVVDLQPLDKDSRFFHAMRAALMAEGYVVDSYFAFGNWHLPCEGLGFDTYFAGLPSRVRNTIQRNRKKLDKNGAWSIEVHSQPGPGMDEAISCFVSVYNRSWKVPEPFPDFVPGLCRMASQEGWLRLGVLKIGDVPAAAQLWLVRDRKALIYKLAYDEAFSAFSPGSVLSAELFRAVLDDEQVVDVDYLTGDDKYKQDWMRQRRERHGIVAFRQSSLRGLLSAGKHMLGKWRRAYQTRSNVQAPTPPVPSDS